MERYLISFSVAFLVLVLNGSAYSQKPPLRVDFDRKIAEATPSSFPKSSVPNTFRGDLVESFLKGKVRRVVVSGKYIGDSAEPTFVLFEQEFDRSGNMTKSVDFHEGYPFKVTVYGFVSGYRVYRSKLVTYGPGERPPFKKDPIQIEKPPDPGLPKSDRYDTRLDYRYDDRGRVAELHYYASDGMPRLSVKYTWIGNRREIRSWIAKENDVLLHTTWGVTTEVFDRAGNPYELFFTDDSGAELGRFRYFCTSDAAGNWTTNNSFQVKNIDGAETLTPYESKFRKITYYE